MDKNCLQCNKVFSKQPSDSKKYWIVKRFCCISCSTKYQMLNTGHPMLGKHFSIEVRNRMSFSKKGKNTGKESHLWKGGEISKTCENCKLIFSVRRHRKDEAKYCSRLCSSKANNKGKTSMNKIIRMSKKYKEWRKLVFERDDYTCQDCGIRNQEGIGKTIELHPHHIKPFAFFPDLRFELNNGITLCRDCHKKTGTFGKRAKKLAKTFGF